MVDRDRTAEYLLRLYDPATKGFRFHSGGETTLLSTCFGVQLAHLLGVAIPEREAMAQGIRRQQEPGGLFVDASFRPDDTTGSHTPEYLKWQFTYFSLIALDLMETAPAHPPAFMRPFHDGDALEQWWNRRNWVNFWYGSNELMFFLFFLTREVERGGADREVCGRCLEWCFDELDRRQDPETGFWGENAREDPANGLYGAAHILLFYDYHGRSFRFGEEIVRTTLRLQAAGGLYGGVWGGACEDYDGVEVLHRCLLAGMGDAAAIRQSLERTRQAVVAATGSEGGFAYRARAQGPFWRRWRYAPFERGTYSYSGWSRMTARSFAPDLWATFFRRLTLAVIEADLGIASEQPAWFYDLPGWGYLTRRGKTNP